MSKKKKVLCIITSVITILIIVILAFAGNYFYNLALNPNTSKEVVFGKDDDSTEASANIEKSNWILDKAHYEDKNISAFDGLKLHAYEVKNPTNTHTWAMTIHGYGSQGSKMERYAENFYNMGYNVLIPDLRAHGQSEGDYIGMGWDDRKDIMKWIDLILEEDPEAEIILHGVSMGGATVMMTSGEDLPDNVKCIIEDCGYTSVWDEFSYQLKGLFNLPEVPVMQSASVVARFRAGYWLSDASSLNQLKKAKVPILFIHGDEDTFVPYYMLDEVYNAADVPKEKLIVNGAAHAKAEETNPELYWSTIDKFIKNYI